MNVYIDLYTYTDMYEHTYQMRVYACAHVCARVCSLHTYSLSRSLSLSISLAPAAHHSPTPPPSFATDPSKCRFSTNSMTSPPPSGPATLDDKPPWTHLREAVIKNWPAGV